MADPSPVLPDASARLRGLYDAGGAELDLLHYADLGEVLGEAGDLGLVDVPAQPEPTAPVAPDDPVDHAVVAERLWLLGYLPPQEVMATAEDAGMHGASLGELKAFQEDAGLEADGWAGPATWKALQELVTFETSADVRTYVRDGQPLPALVRAVRLRLWALGFLQWQPDASDGSGSLPEFELDRFLLMLRRFEVLPYTDPVPDRIRRIEYLFDHDRILDAIAAASREQRVGGARRWVFRYVKETQEKREETDPQVERFLACMAKIELWLLGFDVDIAPVRDFPVYRFRDVDRVPRNDKLSAALGDFWTMVGRDEAHLRDYLTPELFRAMADPATVGLPATEWDEPDYSRRVTTLVDTTQRVDEAWGRGRGLGMRLWDGLKRLWRWIRRGIEKIVQVGVNLARAFFRFASKGYQIARTAVQAVWDAVTQYEREEIEIRGAVQVFIDRDGDPVTWVPSGTSGDDLADASKALAYFGASFVLACRILGAVLRAVRAAVAGAGAALVGWARFLWVLVQVYRDIRPAYLELKQLEKPAALSA